MGLFGKRRATDEANAEPEEKGSLLAATGRLGAMKQTLNRSGWLSEEVLAAGDLVQGTPPSKLGLVTGTALIDIARPRQSKALPRHFVLAMTAHRVVAFSAFGRDGTPESGPYKVGVRRGEIGSWARGSVRLLDLPNGADSDRATLNLGTDQFPVALSWDRETQELVDLLGGGAAARSTADSPKDARYQEDRESLRRAAEARLADYRELAADAARAQPDVDLGRWAQRRGLELRGSVAIGGHLSVTCPWSDELLFNVVRGRWAGGTYGVLCHEARIYAEDEHGFFHGGQLAGGNAPGGWTILDELSPIPLGAGAGMRYFKVPYTSAGTRVPHLATVTGLHVARRAERPTTNWQTRPLDDLGLRDPWVAAIRKHCDEATVERLLRGPVWKLLSQQQGLGFEIRIEYGQVIVSVQDFVKRDEDLDALVHQVEELADGVRSICVPRTSPRSLATPLEPPAWLESVRRKPKKKHVLWPVDALLNPIVKFADERGMVVEDPSAFHRAFPGLNLPGQAFGVLHGPLPGTSLAGRLLCCAERTMSLPDDYRKFLNDPGGAVGSDVAVVAVSSDAPPTPFEGEFDHGLRFAVDDGVLTAWRIRDSWQADGQALDRLAADVAALIERRGLDRPHDEARTA